MKSQRDPRHLKRERIMRELFAWEFNHQAVVELEESRTIIELAEKLDQAIRECAPTWPIDKINKIDLSILRLAIYELEKGDAPHRVVVDEAVELAKAYGSESSPSFINGVLGKHIESLANSPKDWYEWIDPRRGK